jgi:ankyrin repeat protein
MSELGGLDFTALFSAARDCDVDALRELLSAGVSVDHVCRAGGDEPWRGFCLTPLQRVCKAGMNSGKKFEGKVACVKLLIEHGACLDAGAPGNPGQNAYDANTHLDNLTPLMYAAISGDLDIVKILISAGSDVNALCIPNGGAIPRYSALDMATLTYRSRGDPKEVDTMVETLLRAGANPNPPEMDGALAIHMTIAHGRRHVWPLLLRAGAILPTGEQYPWNNGYDTHRAHPYLRKLDAAGGFKAYEKAHRAKLLATFTPKLTYLVPPELVPLIVEFSFHVGFY